MSKRGVLSSKFNMSLGFIPVIVSIILCEFITQDISIYIGAGVGALYSLYTLWGKGARIPNFLLYCTTGMLLLLSLTTLIFGDCSSREMFPLTLEISTLIPVVIIFLNRKRFLAHQISQSQKCCKSIIFAARGRVCHCNNTGSCHHRFSSFPGSLHHNSVTRSLK